MRASCATWAGHGGAIGALLVAWEWAAARGALDPTFFGRPRGMGAFLWKGFAASGVLWTDLAYTVAGAAISFAAGSAAAILMGLGFAVLPRLHAAAAPYLTLVNAMPRIALAPVFLLWFGLGLGSKIAVGASLAFFIVLTATTAGISGVGADHVVLSRTLGASARQIFFKVTLPSAVPVIFAGLRLATIFSLLGVVAAEMIAAEHGLGQALAYLQATFNMDGVMGILLVLALLGLAVTGAMSRLERALLHWR